jgi:hypothetical protein
VILSPLHFFDWVLMHCCIQDLYKSLCVARREIKRLKKGLDVVTRERDSFMLQSLEWKFTVMVLTHGTHTPARRLAVVDGPEGFNNALEYHLPKELPNQLGGIISQCHRAQFGGH